MNWANILGGSWGQFVHHQQQKIHRQNQYADPVFPPGIRGWTNGHIHRMQQGMPGGIINGITSGICLNILDSLFQEYEKDNWWIGRSVRVIAWSLFFFYSRPCPQPGFRSTPNLILSAWKVYNLLNYETIKSNVLCIKEIYRQPISQNFRIAPLDFILPTVIGGIWGAWLYYKQDRRPKQYYPVRPFLEEWALRQQDKLQDSRIGLIGSVALGALGLFTMDQMNLPFCTSSKGGILQRLSCGFLYGLSTWPLNREGFKAIPALLRTNLMMFRFVNWIALINLNSKNIKKMFSPRNVLAQSWYSIIPVILGTVWSTGLFYFQKREDGLPQNQAANSSGIDILKHQYRQLQKGRVDLISTLCISSFSFFALEQFRMNSLTQRVNEALHTRHSVYVHLKLAIRAIEGKQSVVERILRAFYESSLYLLHSDHQWRNRLDLDDIFINNDFVTMHTCNTPESVINLFVNNRNKDFEIDGGRVVMMKKWSFQ